MKRSIPFALIFLVTILSVSVASAQKNQKKAPDPLAEVTTILDSQVTAWNSGEQTKTSSIYYDSPEMLWVNRTGIRKGYEPIRATYQRAPARTPRLGSYSYETLHLEQLSRDCVFFVIKWKVEQAGRTPMNGVTSMVWKRINKKWVVAAEHAS